MGEFKLGGFPVVVADVNQNSYISASNDINILGFQFHLFSTLVYSMNSANAHHDFLSFYINKKYRLRIPLYYFKDSRFSPLKFLKVFELNASRIVIYT